jgi:hypothetical protein
MLQCAMLQNVTVGSHSGRVTTAGQRQKVTDGTTSTIDGSHTASYLCVGWDRPSKKITGACTQQYVSSSRHDASDKKKVIQWFDYIN